MALGWLLAGLVVLAQADVTGSLEGTIYDEGSGKAVGGVKVMISPKGRSPALPPVSPAMKPVISDDEGRFSFNELPPGEYTLNALKKDYFFFGKDQLITIQAGGSVTHVMELRSFRPSEPEADGFGSLSGVVQLTPGREPVVDAVVTLHPQDSDSGQGLDARTRTDGRFEIEDISNGRYILRVSKPGFTDARTNVIIRADQVTTKTVRITPDSGAIPFGSLAGVALNLETGEPIPGVRVSLSPIGQAGYIRLRELGITLPTMETGDDGSYTISDIPEGEYTLSAVLAGYEWVKDSASVEVSGDKETRRQLDLRAPVDDDPEFVKLEGH
ncbi:MAG TPA: carboxypeptidase regulatory-like domain-containing protein, partial [Xanthomonadales bacterium]|nr:carboxypeptidase regulatory-like domain-containing protein [Xanthomonadales bacterium]